jgi:hypothetical protein
MTTTATAPAAATAGGADPRRLALQQHLQQQAAELLEATGAGCIYQLAEAAKEWINGNLPEDVADRRHDQAGAVAGAAAEDVAVGADVHLTAAAAAAVGGEADDGGEPWYLREESDLELVKWATREAAR